MVVGRLEKIGLAMRLSGSCGGAWPAFKTIAGNRSMEISGSQGRHGGAAIDWPVWLVGLFLLLGLLARYALLGHLDGDARTYLTPWFNYARAHGWRALGAGFTNYTPFYGYLLIAAGPLGAV